MIESDTNQLAADCEKCAERYEDRPGTINGLTTVDLYRAIARLARIIGKQQRQLDHLMPDKSSDV